MVVRVQAFLKRWAQSRADFLWGLYRYVTAAPTWNAANKALLFEGSHKGGSNRLYMYSFNGQPPYPVPENIISGDLSCTSFSADGTKLFVSDATGKGDVYTQFERLEDQRTDHQLRAF